MLSIKTLYRGRISTFFPKELQDLEFLSLPFHLKWIWLQEMHYMSGIRSPTEFSTWQFLRLRSLSFPYSLVIVAPSSPRTQETVPEPLPTPDYFSHLCSQLFTPFSQLLSEITRYFGPNDRGANGIFHPTQMRSCMWTLSANYKILIR